MLWRRYADDICGKIIVPDSDSADACVTASTRSRWSSVLGDIYLTEMKGTSLMDKTLSEVSGDEMSHHRVPVLCVGLLCVEIICCRNVFHDSLLFVCLLIYSVRHVRSGG